MRTPDDERWIAPFIAALKRLLGEHGRERDAAALARLRRALTGHSAERDIWVYGHLRGAAPAHEEHAALVASLFALWHQGMRDSETKPPRSLGASFKALADAKRRKSGTRPGDPVPNVERRFACLLDSHPDDLAGRLRHAVSLLKSKDIPIDWEQLLYDLLDWNGERRPVQRRWARDFWTARRPYKSTSVDTNAETMTADANADSSSEETHNDR